ncbi:MAG: helix-turn-helix domain-containing protein [Thermoanaerobaculia bacterium]
MSTEEKFRRPPQYDPEDAGTFIAFLRLLRGWSQADLANALGLTAGAISRYETGDVVPDRDRLEHIARVVGLPLRMLDRVYLPVAAARSAVASAADPGDLDRRFAALTRDLAASLFDFACLAMATILAEFPDLALGPWARSALTLEAEDFEDLEEEPEGWDA